MKNIKCLYNLDLSLAWNNEVTNKVLRITLKLGGCRRVTKLGLYRSLRTLLRFPILKNVSFAFNGCKKIEDKNLRMITSFFPKCRHLDRIGLNLSDCRYVKDDGLYYIAKGIARLHDLRQFMLNVNIGIRHNRLTNRGFCRLMPSLLKFQSLSDLRLEFEGSQINNVALETYCETVLKLDKITYLELNIGSCFNITSSGLNMLAETIAQRTKLTGLVLNLGFCDNINVVWMRKFRQALNQLPELRKLHLDLIQCSKIKTRAVQILSKAISQNTKLEDVRLSLNRLDLQDKDLNNVLLSISNSKEMKYLTLELENSDENCKITDQGMKKLASTIISLQKLTRISLILPGSNEITDEGFQTLAGSLFKNGNISSFTLSFRECKNVSDASLKLLTKLIKSNMKRLKDVSIESFVPEGTINKSQEALSATLSLISRS